MKNEDKILEMLTGIVQGQNKLENAVTKLQTDVISLSQGQKDLAQGQNELAQGQRKLEEGLQEMREDLKSSTSFLADEIYRVMESHEINRPHA